jgi:hypothetical protein
MEAWLVDLAAQREYGFVDQVRVQINGDDTIPRRSIHVDASIVELPGLDRARQDEVQRTEVYRVVKSTGDVSPKLLRFVGGDNAGETIILRRPTISIGRALDNDVIVDSAEVSRHHARIEVRHGTFEIVDLGSTNGTAVNGRPANHTRLNHGDRITLGTVALDFLPYTGPGAAAPSAR